MCEKCRLPIEQVLKNSETVLQNIDALLEQSIKEYGAVAAANALSHAFRDLLDSLPDDAKMNLLYNTLRQDW